MPSEARFNMFQTFTKFVALTFLLPVGFVIPMRADTVIYSTSFESPTFTTGPIAGQDGWSVYGPSSPSVEDFFADTGSQAVFVDGGAASQSGPYHTDVSTGPLIDLSADIAIFSSSTQTEWQFGALGPGLVGYLGGVDILPNNTIEALSAGSPVIGTFTRATAFDSAAWQNINLLFNLSTQTYDISLNGTLLASNLPFCGSNGSCTGATLNTYANGFFDSFGGGNDSGYLDNYSVTLVTSTPEPSTTIPMVSVLVAGVTLLWRRRFRRV
jgi:hypothetical protein